MTNHTPLNGDQLLDVARSALQQRPSTAQILSDHLAGQDQPAPETEATGPARATDPSQGSGGYTPKCTTDPLVAALQGVLGGTRRRGF